MVCGIISITIGIPKRFDFITMNNYNKRDGGKRSDKDHDILGIVLMIISAFLLLCSAVPVIFGPVSKAVQSVFLGVFGIFAYALFAFVFAVGLSLLLRRSVSVSAKKIAVIAGIAFFLMLLLQLITTHSVLEEDTGVYIKTVYDQKWTAGGVIFGIIAYGVKSLLTVVGSYIVVSLLLAGCVALLVYLILKDKGIILAVRRASGRSVSRRERNSAPEQEYYDEPDTLEERVDKSNESTSLFVANVTGRNENTEEPEKTGLYSLYDDNVSFNSSDRKRYTHEQATEILYRSFTPDIDDPIMHERKLREEVPEEKTDLGGGYYSATEAEQKNVRPAAVEATPDIHDAPSASSSTERKKPDKIFHESSRGSNGFSDLTLPTPKMPEREYDSDGIINSKMFGNQSNVSSFATFNSDSGKNGFTGYTRGEDAPSPGMPAERDRFDAFEQPSKPVSQNDYSRENGGDDGIISGDSYNYDSIEETVKSATQAAAEKEEKRQSGYSGYGGLESGSFGVTGRNIANNDSIIVSNGWLDEVSEASGETESAEEDALRQKPFYESSEEDPTFGTFSEAPPIMTETKFDRGEAEKAEKHTEQILHSADSERDQTAPVRHEEPVESIINDGIISADREMPDAIVGDDGDKLIIADEVVDGSERSSFDGKDSTGYYTHEKQPSSQSKPVPAENIAKPEPAPAPQKTEKPAASAPAVSPTPPDEPYVYDRPSLDLLGMPEEDSVVDSAEIESKTQAIEEILSGLRFPAKVCNVIVGPSVTRFELQPPQGIPVRRILTLDKDLELTLASGAIRIEAPVANKQVVGIEVANRHPVSVAFREIIDSHAFKESRSVLPLALGKDIGGDAIIRPLEKMPHLLVAGATNMGKSVCLNTIIMSLIYKNSPEDVRIVLVDPKQIEFTLYRGLPHLLLENPITDVNHAVNALNYLIDEMERRFELFNGMAQSGYAVRNLEEYNKCELVRKGKAKKIPYIVMIVDELADLMTTRKKDVEGGIRRIAQKARAAGIHLVLATQRPSVDIITGSIKVNLPSRISLKVTSNADSRTVLDQGGAEALIGRGDMLLMCNSEPIRLQGAFLTNEEIVSIVKYVKEHNKAIFDKDIEKAILVEHEESDDSAAPVSDSEESADEKMFPGIMRCFINSGKASTSLIQTRFSLGYARAARIINTFEMRKWVGPSTGAKPREVYMTETQFETVFGESFNEQR